MCLADLQLKLNSGKIKKAVKVERSVANEDHQGYTAGE
jgi:hypothetical protein